MNIYRVYELTCEGVFSISYHKTLDGAMNSLKSFIERSNKNFNEDELNVKNDYYQYKIDSFSTVCIGIEKLRD